MQKLSKIDLKHKFTPIFYDCFKNTDNGQTTFIIVMEKLNLSYSDRIIKS